MEYKVKEQGVLYVGEEAFPGVLLEANNEIDFSEIKEGLRTRYVLFLEHTFPNPSDLSDPLVETRAYPSNTEKQQLTPFPVVVYKNANLEKGINLFTEDAVFLGEEAKADELSYLFARIKQLIASYKGNYQLKQALVFLRTSELWLIDYLTDLEEGTLDSIVSATLPPHLDKDSKEKKVNLDPKRKHSPDCPLHVNNKSKKGVH